MNSSIISVTLSARPVRESFELLWISRRVSTRYGDETPHEADHAEPRASPGHHLDLEGYVGKMAEALVVPDIAAR